jgi:hypothetical protein
MNNRLPINFIAQLFFYICYYGVNSFIVILVRQKPCLVAGSSADYLFSSFSHKARLPELLQIYNSMKSKSRLSLSS